MPLMPMPPMPTKCTGPMSRGSFMKVALSLASGAPNPALPVSAAISCRTWKAETRPAKGLYSNSRHLYYQVGQPFGGIGRAAAFGALGHLCKPRGVIRQRRDFSGQALGREVPLLDAD